MKKLSQFDAGKFDLFAVDLDGTCGKNPWPTADAEAIELMSNGRIKLNPAEVFKMFKASKSHKLYYDRLAEICLEQGFQLEGGMKHAPQGQKIALIVELIKKSEEQIISKHYKSADYKFKEGMTEVFDYLGAPDKLNKTIVLATNVERHLVEHLQANPKLKMDKLFRGIYTGSDVKNKKPDPEMILQAMDDFGIQDPKKVLMIGDGGPDIALSEKKELKGMETLNMVDPPSVDEEEQAYIDRHTDYKTDTWLKVKKQIERTYGFKPKGTEK